MDTLKIIQKYYIRDSKSYELIVLHGNMVAARSLAIAKKLKLPDIDLQFLKEAAMLHDIGMFLTDAPEIGCFGKEEYIKHGVLGRQILDKEGLPRHALVCERHVGLGLSAKEIDEQNLPLERRDMLPISVEEQIISFADLFYSKINVQSKEPTPEEIRKKMAKFGEAKVQRFNDALRKFG